MAKNFTFILIFLFGLNFSYGQQVPESAAKEIAEKFLSGRTGSGGRVSELELVHKVSPKAINATNATASETYFYVFNEKAQSGFVIVSGDERALPILAYSDENSFVYDNIPPNVAKWLEGYKNELRHLIRTKKEPTETIREQWRNLKSGQVKNNADARTKSVGPLIQTTWNQSPYYNALCPFDTDYNDRTVTGCVATAMAQVMKYWNYPANGTGFHSYNHSTYGTLSANFAASTYEWSSMPNVVNSPNNAVATLMYDCGVSLDMNYGVAATGGSSTNSLEPVAMALKTYFQYSSSVEFVYKTDYSNDAWISLLKAELDAGRPIEYAGIGTGGGHAFVCDGYDNNNFFHFNWGWGGQSDGYFLINSLDPNDLGTGGGQGGYNSSQQAVIGIEPPAGVTTYSLGLNDYVTPSNVSIAYGQAFNLSTNIINQGSNTFTGDYSAAVFDNAYNFAGFLEILSGYSLQSGFTYTNNLVFSTDGMLSMLPGTYYLAIYYKPTGGNWSQISDNGSYTNLVEITVVNTNDISLNSAIAVTPGTLTQGQPISVSLNIINNGASTFTGEYDVSLYRLDGTFAQTIETIEETEGLPSGFTYNSPITFSASSITVSPGTYLLAVAHNPGNTGWQLTGTGNFQNPITVTVAAPPIAPDSYEDNDVIPKAFNLPVTFSGTSVTKTTSGSNCHTGSDYDYYKITLPDGYGYSISARLHDAYNSSNGNTYTLDALVSWSADGSTWSDAYDDVISEAIEVDGPKTIYFHVAPYFAGETGTYLLDIDIERALIIGVEETVTDDLVNVYPNPASEILSVDISKFSGRVKSIALHNIRGMQVFNTTGPDKETVEVPVLDLADGFYFLQLGTEKGLLTKKIIIKK